MAQVLDYALQVRDRFKDFRETRLSTVRPLNEFVDYHRISRPRDTNEAVQRLTYNTRHFSGNYAVVIVLLAVYGLIMAPLLIVAVGILVGGFAAINRFAPEPMQVGNHVVTQKGLYTALFVVGIVLLWFANPFSFVFWLVGSSAILILGHAAFIEPPVSSEYAGVETV
ncbi:Prenylated Rab acceptor 1 [Malassezia brasiliensis]|uniref:PRA1 family protein n=1 Tax=Malassezia brasiliensis TaxID=1821822 RepID=A0AAF0DTV1_9BASI|nr:Prenylated Rab acceptor 1 [Malassezia brasiliensis]